MKITRDHIVQIGTLAIYFGLGLLIGYMMGYSS